MLCHGDASCRILCVMLIHIAMSTRDVTCWFISDDTEALMNPRFQAV